MGKVILMGTKRCWMLGCIGQSPPGESFALPSQAMVAATALQSSLSDCFAAVGSGSGRKKYFIFIKI